MSITPHASVKGRFRMDSNLLEDLDGVEAETLI
jgi:hypothetical protein